jgi:hypothetical protein
MVYTLLMNKSAGTVTVRVYIGGVLVGEEEVSGPLSASPAKSGKTKGDKRK